MSAAQIDPLALLGGEFGGFGGFDWAVPAFVMTVPGLLLILAILAQAGLGILWLPLVRRKLGAFGVQRRRLRRTARP
ncbi:MAG: hypothetical protein E6H96_03535 [Chloroflexi bacterium]|nr:MAG: hypothetical protein E6H96_03535 [Chloroflexota bacterium]